MPLASNMLPLGTPVPDVTLPGVYGTPRSIVQIAANRPLLVCLLCNHCPYVQHLELGISALERDYPDLAIAGICSNDADNYPDDDVPGLLAQIDRTGWTFPYLVDADQSVAHQFQAACTPDFFLFDAAGTLAYRGAFDDARPKQPTPVTGNALRAALDALARGETPHHDQRPALGCGIKWKPGNAPQ